MLRNRQLSGSRDGGGSRAAVAAQLAGEPGWDKGRAGRGWHGAAAFAAEGGTGVLRALRASGARARGEEGARVMEGLGWEPACSELRVVRRGRDEGFLGGGGGVQKRAPQTGVAIAGPTRRPRGRLNLKNGGAAPVVAGLVFFLHANPGTTGTAIPACVPGVPHYAWGRLHPAGRLRAGRAAEAAPRRLRAGVVGHTTHAPPPPGRAGERRRGPSLGASPDCRSGAGAAERERVLKRDHRPHLEDRDGLVAGDEESHASPKWRALLQRGRERTQTWPFAGALENA